MNLTRFALRNRAIVFAVVGLTMLAGARTFLTMPRREDPEILIRACVVVTQWPGATAEKVEDLVTDPLEAAIQDIDEVDRITSESRTGQSLITVEMAETITDVDQLWDEVRNKVDQVTPTLPEGCRTPWVNASFGDVYSTVLAFYQVPAPGQDARERPYTPREMEVLAERVRDELKTIDAVARVDLFGVQDEIIWIEADAAEWSKIGLTSADLRSLLQARNIVAPGGQIHTDRTRFSVIPSGEFQGVEQIREVLVDLQDDAVPVQLGDLPLRLTRAYQDPPTQKVRFLTPDRECDLALLLGVSMKSGENVVEMGAAIQEGLDRLRQGALPPDVDFAVVNDLPRQVDTLVRDFVTNLWQAIGIVLIVAFLMMGWRPAVIMATAIPLCMISSLLVVNALGVELEQFSIASLIIALGMLVDNAIVVSENALTEIQKGGDRDAAVERGTWDLAIPILTSTLTTVGAFLPMVTIVGSVGEYVRSLPIVVATCLLISYVVAMTVTPILCSWLLRPTPERRSPHVPLHRRLWALVRRRKAPAGASAPAAPTGTSAYESVIHWCLGHKTLTLGAALAAVVGSLLLVPRIGSQFFPGGIRDQVWIHVWLPEGSSLAATEARVRQLERILRETSAVEIDGEVRQRLASVTSIVGTGGPRLNLTTTPEQSYPNYALLLVNTTDPALSRPWAEEVAARAAGIPGVRIDVKPFQLGPAVDNPVEFRLIGDDPDLLRASAAEMIDALRQVPGAVEPWSNWYNDTAQIDVRVDPRAANLAGVTNQDVADTMDSLLSGRTLTTYREGDHTVKVLLRVRNEDPERLLEDLEDLYVNGRAGKVPLGSIAAVTSDWAPAVIARQDTRRAVTVGCRVDTGFLANQVSARARARLEPLLADLPPTYRLEDGGEREKTQESSAKIVGAFQISIFLILLVLIAQYNSLVKPLVVLSTVPLALIGALLGLLVTGWPLGFMPSLGIVSLAGVVINNAIILIEVIEGNVGRGMDLRPAIAKAGSQRMKPIVLTTLTTVAGMLPLALFGGPMWAGMAWVVIFGLALSTGLTLLVVPTIYLSCVQAFRLRVAGRRVT